jgi:hypothetical protein
MAGLIIYRIGIEIIAGSTTAAAIQALSGSDQDRQFRHALLITGESGETAVPTGKGLHIADREPEIDTAADRGCTLRGNQGVHSQF